MSTLMRTLAPGFLLSMPQLSDPNFQRAVVLMVEHDDDGSFGLTLNQPLPLTIGEVVENIDATWAGAPDAIVYRGGPVMPGSAWVVHSGPQRPETLSHDLQDALEETGHLYICEGLTLSTSEENIRDLVEAPPEQLRFLLGYAGWSAGQLAMEMSEGAWLHADLNPELMFSTAPEELWETLLRRMGVDPEAIVPSRGVH